MVPSANAKKPKVDGEMIKRLVVGFAAMSWWLIPMYAHPFLIGPFNILVAGVVGSETFNIYRKDFEGTDNNFLFRFCLLFFAYLYCMPRFGIFERKIMENTGFTAEENPWLFTILYERNSEICLTALCVLFVWLIC